MNHEIRRLQNIKTIAEPKNIINGGRNGVANIHP